MDDLVEFLIALMQNDATLLSIFQGAGQKNVVIGGMQRRIEGTYPKIIIYAQDGNQYPSGDEDPSITDGRIKLEVAVRQDAACIDAEATRQAITTRLKLLFLGNWYTGEPNISGTQVSPNYKVMFFRQIAPTGEIPSLGAGTIPQVVRWVGTYAVRMNNNSLYGLGPNPNNNLVY